MQYSFIRFSPYTAGAVLRLRRTPGVPSQRMTRVYAKVIPGTQRRFGFEWFLFDA